MFVIEDREAVGGTSTGREGGCTQKNAVGAERLSGFGYVPDEECKCCYVVNGNVSKAVVVGLPFTRTMEYVITQSSLLSN